MIYLTFTHARLVTNGWGGLYILIYCSKSAHILSKEFNSSLLRVSVIASRSRGNPSLGMPSSLLLRRVSSRARAPVKSEALV